MAERDRKDDPIKNQKRVLDATVARSESEDEPEGVILWGDTEPTTLITLVRRELPMELLTPRTESPAP